MNDRLLELRNILNLNQAEFGEKVGLSKASISALESGTRNITDRHIMLLCSEFNINERWLRTGEGEIFIETDSTILAELANEYHLDEIDKIIIEHYIKLDSDDRKKLKNHVLSLAAQINSLEETAASTTEDEIELELENYRLELEAEKKGETSSASEKQKGNAG